MRRTTALLTALSSLAVVTASLPVPAAHAAAGTILLGVHTKGESISLLTAMNAWEGKPNAFADTEQGWHLDGTLHQSGATDQQTTFKKLNDIWNAKSIPLLSWYPNVGQPSDDLGIARGGEDPYLVSFCNKLRTWLSGPDGTYGNGDDRRLFLRFAPEMNGNWHTYSPTYHADGQPAPTPATEQQNAVKFVAMWQHVHSVFTGIGLDSSHVAWVFAAAQADSYFGDGNGNQVAVMEQLFPGDSFTDWVGVDGYNRGGLHMNAGDHWISAADIFTPMLARLRAVSTRPTAVSEVGTTAVQDDGTASDTAKNAWLTDYGNWVTASGVRMAMYWDDDVSNVTIKPDFPVFGGTTGPDTYLAGTTAYRAYGAYATVVSGSTFLGADLSNKQVVTDAAFLGT